MVLQHGKLLNINPCFRFEKPGFARFFVWFFFLFCLQFLFRELSSRGLTTGPRLCILMFMWTAEKYYYVYIMASSRNGTLYVGFTSNLVQRVFEHKNHLLPGFTSRYNVDKSVYFERFTDVNRAIRHEKRLKEWQRNWKKDLIEKFNPQWRDLYEDLNNLL